MPEQSSPVKRTEPIDVDAEDITGDKDNGMKELTTTKKRKHEVEINKKRRDIMLKANKEKKASTQYKYFHRSKFSIGNRELKQQFLGINCPDKYSYQCIHTISIPRTKKGTK